MRLGLIALAATGLFAAAAHAGDGRGLYNYERPISGLDPALPCSQLRGYIQHVKMDLSLIRSDSSVTAGRPLNSDTSGAHSGDNWSNVQWAPGNGSSNAGYYEPDTTTGSYDTRRDDDAEDNARRSLDYLIGLRATCTADS